MGSDWIVPLVLPVDLGVVRDLKVPAVLEEGVVDPQAGRVDALVADVGGVDDGDAVLVEIVRLLHLAAVPRTTVLILRQTLIPSSPCNHKSCEREPSRFPKTRKSFDQNQIEFIFSYKWLSIVASQFFFQL